MKGVMAFSHDPARLIQKPGPRDGRHGSASRSVEEANPDPTFKGREFSAQSRLFHAKDIGGIGRCRRDLKSTAQS